MMHRRLARNYETLTASSEAMIHIASIYNLTKRITDETTSTWRGTYQDTKGNTPTSNTLPGPHAATPRGGQDPQREFAVAKLYFAREIFWLMVPAAARRAA